MFNLVRIKSHYSKEISSSYFTIFRKDVIKFVCISFQCIFGTFIVDLCYLNSNTSGNNRANMFCYYFVENMKMMPLP